MSEKPTAERSTAASAPERPLRIGLFTDTFTPEINGVVSSVVMLREGLEALGHQVWVICPRNPKGDEDDPHIIRVPSLPLVVLPLPDYRVATPVWPRVDAKIKALKLDIVHTHSEFAVARFGAREARRHHVPLVHTNHTVWEEYTHYLAPSFLDPQARAVVRTATRIVARGAARIIAPTEKTRLLLTGYGVKRPMDVVPTGVDTARFSPSQDGDRARLDALRERLGTDRFERTLLIIGRIAPEKSVIEMLDLVAPYLRAHPHVGVLVVGDGPSRGDLEAMAIADGISSQVIFTGPVLWEDVPDLYRISDVLIGNSHTETQGLTFIEALASGVPIVVRHNQCFDGVIEDGVSGTLFRASEQFEDGLRAVLDDPTLYAARVKAGLKAAGALSKESFAEQVVKVYRRALAAGDF